MCVLESTLRLNTFGACRHLHVMLSCVMEDRLVMNFKRVVLRSQLNSFKSIVFSPRSLPCSYLVLCSSLASPFLSSLYPSCITLSPPPSILHASLFPLLFLSFLSPFPLSLFIKYSDPFNHETLYFIFLLFLINFASSNKTTWSSLSPCVVLNERKLRDLQFNTSAREY